MYKFILLHKTLGRYVLKHDPIGWDSQKLTFKRSNTYHGITVEYSQELEFIKDGKDYLQTVYEAEGIEGVVEVIVQAQNLNLRWETQYIGVINFSKYENGETRLKTNIEQTGFTRRFLNGEDIEVDLNSLKGLQGEPLLPYNTEERSITLHSKTISQEYSAKVLPEQPDVESAIIEDSNARDSTIIIGWDAIEKNELGAYTYGTGFDVDGNVWEIFKESETSGPMHLQIRLKAFVEMRLIQGDFDEAAIQFFYRKNNGPAQTLYSATTTSAGGSFGRTVDFNFETDEDITVGDKLYFWGRIYGGDVSGAYRWRNFISIDKAVSFIKATAYTVTSETGCRGRLAHETAARLVQAITGTTDPLVSEFLGRTDSEPRAYAQDGPGSLLFFTNGYQIRNFPVGLRPVTTNFKKFYDGLDAIYNIGVGVEIIEGRERVRIEQRSYFYNPVPVLKLGGVSKLKKSLAAEYIYNQAEFGYSKWETQADGGLDEFNSKREYALPITQIKKKYSAISGFIAGGYTIESTRREQYSIASTKDSSTDNDIFVICVLRSGLSFVTERAQAYQTITGIIGADTVYNARISPARMLLNHGSTLKAGLLHQIDKYIRFTTGTGNYRMASQMIGELNILAENQDFLIAELPDPPFMPEYYTFEYGLQAHEIALVRANPYGLITFEDSLGNEKAGYLVELKADPAGVSDFKLLRKFE